MFFPSPGRDLRDRAAAALSGWSLPGGGSSRWPLRRTYALGLRFSTRCGSAESTSDPIGVGGFKRTVHDSTGHLQAQDGRVRVRRPAFEPAVAGLTKFPFNREQYWEFATRVLAELMARIAFMQVYSAILDDSARSDQGFIREAFGDRPREDATKDRPGLLIRSTEPGGTRNDP